MKLYLQSIIDDISFDSLPVKWQSFDLAKKKDEKNRSFFEKK